jgi:hypothetical protein
MAFRAGIPIINMEFLSPANFSIGNFELNLGSPRNTTQPAGSVVEADGEVIVPRTYFYDWERLGQEKVDTAEALRNQMAAPPSTHRQYFECITRKRSLLSRPDRRGRGNTVHRMVDQSRRQRELFLHHLKRPGKVRFQKGQIGVASQLP